MKKGIPEVVKGYRKERRKTDTSVLARIELSNKREKNDVIEVTRVGILQIKMRKEETSSVNTQTLLMTFFDFSSQEEVKVNVSVGE